MRRLFDALSADGRCRDFLVWAGVGDGRALDAARALGARDALYIEPHPRLRERLLARHPLFANERLSERPLWRASGPVVFHMTNDAGSSTLLPFGSGKGPGRNVRVVEERLVEADSLDSAMARLPADACAGLLILDAAGASAYVLGGAAQDTLARFDTIVVPARESEGVEPLLETRFGAAQAVHDENGHAWAVFLAAADDDRRDDDALERELESRSAELQARCSELEAARARVAELSNSLEAAEAARAQAESASAAEQAARLQALQGEHERALAALRAEHAVALSQVHEQLVAVGAERDAVAAESAARKEEAEGLREALASAAAESARATAELAGDRDAQAARALDLQQKLTHYSNEAQQTIGALTRERDTANAALVEANAARARLEDELGQQRARGSELATRAESLERQLVEARQVATLSVKLQAQRDADLADLQERYRESQVVQARQRELLEKLGARLSVASHYFHQLADGRETTGGDGDIVDAALPADFDGEVR